MKIYFDTRLGYLVTAPGQDTKLETLVAKAGDTVEIVLQFGQSAEPTASLSVLDAPAWTSEARTASTVITLGLKASGDYSDGTSLASSSSYVYDAGDKTYTFSIDLNTTAINTALGRVDANDANDTATIACEFEVTYQEGGAGGWQSSIYPVELTLYHDVISGSEGTPTNADDPTEYVLKVDGITWVGDATSLTGGTAADFDAIATASLTLGQAYGMSDADTSPETLRIYKLYSGTDATSAPDVIRGTDYDGTTNQRVWKLQKIATTGITQLLDDTTPQLGGMLDANGSAIGDGTLEILKFGETASAVNEVTITNNATGSGPTISATGDDTNIDLNLAGKGSGVPKIGSSAILTAADTTRAILAGSSGGQTLVGGTASGNSLVLQSTSHAVKSGVSIATGDYLEVGNMTEPSAPAVDRVRIFGTANVLYAKDTNGTVSALAGASSYKNIFLAPEFFGEYSTIGASLTSSYVYISGTFGLYPMSWAFDDTTAEGIDLTFPVPHDMVVADDLKIKLTWTQNHANTGNVVWTTQSYYSGFGADGSTYPSGASYGLLTNTTDAGGSAGRINRTAAITLVAGGNLTVGNLFHFRIQRNATSGSDTMTGDALLLYAEMQYSAKHSSTSW